MDPNKRSHRPGIDFDRGPAHHDRREQHTHCGYHQDYGIARKKCFYLESDRQIPWVSLRGRDYL